MTADRERTVAVVSTSAVPTGRMVIDVDERFPELAAAARQDRRRHARASTTSTSTPSGSRSALFGDHMMTNTLALGAAYQRGLLPVSGEALERAIELNGAAVEKNLAALRWGRAVVAAPDAVEAATRAPEAVEAGARAVRPRRSTSSALAVNGDRGELRRLAEVRVPELVAYQNADWARRWAEARPPRARGRAGAHAGPLGGRRGGGPPALQADGLQGRVRGGAPAPRRRRARQAATPSSATDAKVYFMLHPPLLRALGLKRKLKLGRWFVPAFRLLYRMRRLRGTRLDPFGHAEVRRVERELIAEYEALVDEALVTARRRTRTPPRSSCSSCPT